MLFNLLFQEPLVFLPLIMALLIALTFHEVSHGIVALWLGDHTAKDEGRLSFNPLAHIDWLGLALLMFVGFGWGKPVPVNYFNLKYQRWGPAIVAVAGPISNLLMVIVFGALFKLLAPDLNPINLGQVIAYGNLMHMFLAFLIIYNIVLMVFNLIPVPPLDGSKVLLTLLPDRYQEFKIWLQTRGPLVLLGLLIIDSFTGGYVFGGLFNWLLGAFARFF